ncbi:MAG: universal stress protein [Methyloligellaceae bacterium]
MESILFASDLSVQSNSAMQRASMLAAQHQCDFSIVHVIDGSLPSSIANTLQNDVQRHLQEQIELQKVAGSKPITAEILVGKKSVEIIEFARKQRCGLIVLGTHNVLFEDFFRGTTIEQIIRMGEFPVLMVTRTPEKVYERVVIAVDFSSQSRKAIEQAVDLCPDAEFYLIHAYEPQFKDFVLGEDFRKTNEENDTDRFERLIDDEMSSILQKMHVAEKKIHQVIRQGNVNDVLRAAINEYKPGLLAIGTHGRSGIANALIGSVTEKLLNNPPCDILTVKAW